MITTFIFIVKDEKVFSKLIWFCIKTNIYSVSAHIIIIIKFLEYAKQYYIAIRKGKYISLGRYLYFIFTYFIKISLVLTLNFTKQKFIDLV